VCARVFEQEQERRTVRGQGKLDFAAEARAR
jgi:hypothetical protein